MRPATRLFAAVRPARVLQPNAPTGLTGLKTHPSPRSTLIYLYSSILSKLEAHIPATSVYRQATENLTRKRLAAIEAVKPPGYDTWAAQAEHELEKAAQALPEEERAKFLRYGGNVFVHAEMFKNPIDERVVEWDGDRIWQGREGSMSEVEYEKDWARFEQLSERDLERKQGFKVNPEPPLTIEQVEGLEKQFGAGLIEEVIEVARGENHLVDTMIENKVWEDLTERTPEGQWEYFERGQPKEV